MKWTLLVVGDTVGVGNSVVAGDIVLLDYMMLVGNAVEVGDT